MKRPLALALIAVLALAACQKKPAAPAASSADAAKATSFMSDNAKKPGVVTLEPGLEYQVLTPGPAGGVSPGPHDEVKIFYEGKLTDGTVFDSSYQRGRPDILPVDGVVPGFSKALQHMKPGDIWTVWIGPDQGYGDQATGPIPPDSVLVFKIEMQAVAAAPAMG